MYCAVFVYGGVIDFVKIDNDYENLKRYIEQTVTKFDPSEDCIQIWDNKGNILYSYGE